VLVPVFYADHPHHTASLAALVRYDSGQAACGAQSLAEIFATLTGMPGKARVTAATALVYLNELKQRLRFVALASDEYPSTL
jgi:hypothetical protein